MKTKAFMDNNRLVFVIENCKPEVKQQLIDLLKPEFMNSVDAAPAQFVDYSSKELRQDVEALNGSRFNGTTDKSFKRLSQHYKDGSLPETEEDVKYILNTYLMRRFVGVNPSEAASKLTDGQCVNFVETYDFALDHVWEKSHSMTRDNFSTYPLKDKQLFIKTCLEFFLSIGKKK